MALRCGHCSRSLIRKRIRGKIHWECRYSHSRRRKSVWSSQQMCRKCKKHPVYSEGVCITCYLYRR